VKAFPPIGTTGKCADAHSKFLLSELLKRVSRSFYLTLSILPRRVRDQIGLAYLLARTSDTIADTEVLPLEQRLDALSKFRSRICGTAVTTDARRQASDAPSAPARQAEDNVPLDFAAFLRSQGSEGEQTLLQFADQSVALLSRMAPVDQQRIKTVIETIISGQELDLRRFANASPEKVISLQNSPELDDYTYRVAGCVGEFWTHMCRTHVFPKAKLQDETFLRNGVRFGNGLQLVNILRDIPADLQKGRCYLPADELSRAGLLPADLLNPSSEARFRPVYNAWLDTARNHLEAGWAYTNAIPMRFVRVRLACAWPVLIGLATLSRLRTGRILDPAHRIKVSRAEVRKIIAQSLVRYPFKSAWANLGRSR
jgi:farnesyl-diphosphate farnesyltransferase